MPYANKFSILSYGHAPTPTFLLRNAYFIVPAQLSFSKANWIRFQGYRLAFLSGGCGHKFYRSFVRPHCYKMWHPFVILRTNWRYGAYRYTQIKRSTIIRYEKAGPLVSHFFCFASGVCTCLPVCIYIRRRDKFSLFVWCVPMRRIYKRSWIPNGPHCRSCHTLFPGFVPLKVCFAKFDFVELLAPSVILFVNCISVTICAHLVVPQ